MAVNNTIWGSKNSWVALYETNTDNLNDDLKVYARPEPISEYATTSIGAPIDKSVCVSGLGAESVLSSIKYIDVNAAHEQSTPSIVPATFADTRTVTNWCFCTNTNPLQTGGLGQSNNGLVDADSNVVNTNPLIQRYAPDPVQLNGNTANIRPFTQFSHKNLVMLIMVLVTSDFATYNFYTLDDYINSHTDENLITGVYLRPYVATNDNDVSTGNPRVVLEGTILPKVPMQIAILDEWGLPVTKPYIYGGLYGNLQSAFRIMGTVGYAVASGYPPIECRISNDIDKKVYLAFYGTDAWAFKMDYKESTNIKGQYYRFYNETFLDECLTQAACFGLLFTPKESVARAGAIDDDDMYCGILDANLIGHGEYTHGERNADNAQLNWTNSNDSTYNPAFRPDPNNYNGQMGTHDIPQFGTATVRYNLSAISTQLSLLPKLWDVMALADPDADKVSYSLDMFLASNPIDSIVSLQFLPVKNIGVYVAGTTVHLGKYDTGIPADVAKTSIRFDCGDYEVYPVFGDNWIDREIQISLYLPFCGCLNLEPEMYIGKTINVEYMIDLTTGSCSAILSFVGDNGKRIITDVANGMCAIDLPVTGIQQQTLNSQLFNASETTKQLKVNNSFKGFRSLMGAVSSLNGDPMGSINSILGAGQDIYNIFQGEKIADYNLQHTMLPTKMIGTSSSLTGAMCELRPTIIFSRPTLGYNEDFAHCQGFACCLTDTLSGYSGYTEIVNPDLSGFTATAAEKEMIKSLLASGVYL